MKFTLAVFSTLVLSASAFVPAPAFCRVKTAVFMSSDNLAKVQEIAAAQLGVDADTVKPESTFEELGADSLDQVELVMAVEEEFDIEIDDAAAGDMASVQDVLDYLDK